MTERDDDGHLNKQTGKVSVGGPFKCIMKSMLAKKTKDTSIISQGALSESFLLMWIKIMRQAFSFRSPSLFV